MTPKSNRSRVPEWHQRWLSIVTRTVRVHDEAVLKPLLASMRATDSPRVLVFVNAHAMNLVATSRRFYESTKSADLLLRDGSGMSILFKMLKLQPGLNLNGTDLIPRIITLFDGQHIALFGTCEPYLDRAREAIAQQLSPNSSVVEAHGFMEAADYLVLAQKQHPSLIVLGMGMPKQEHVAAVLRAGLDFPCLIVCGGAIIDFLGGRASRAPLWMRGLGIEWVYRFLMEPGRLFRRYVLGNPAFLTRSFLLKTAIKARSKEID